MTANRRDAWKPEEDAVLLNLRRDRIAWADVARKVGRSVHSCWDRYKRIAPKDRPRYARQKGWTEQEKATLHRMRGEGKSPKEIAATLGRTVSMVHSMMYYERSFVTRQFKIENTPRVWVPPDREADRDRRMAAERDITSLFFGDPAPGQSALDKRQSAFA